MFAVPGSERFDAKVYLVGWNQSNAGLLVIEHIGVNGTVCDDSFDLADGDVVCHMLGYSHALEVLGGFGFYFDERRQDSNLGPVWIDDLQCRGNETSIEECTFPGWGITDCLHYEDVYLICSGELVVEEVSMDMMS